MLLCCIDLETSILFGNNCNAIKCNILIRCILCFFFYRPVFTVFKIQNRIPSFRLTPVKYNIVLVKTTMYVFYDNLMVYFANRSVTWQVQNTQHAINFCVLSGKLYCTYEPILILAVSYNSNV